MDNDELRPTYQVRVIEEKIALDEKLGKLGAFLDGPASAAAKDVELLSEQRIAMATYSAILGKRIEGFDA